ncbi:hypothetical protein EMPS_05720 [Entomortierella parvispora]|uniref:Uncharacterized protein n=1 Tax=Entomortierella parvispora TaxID=205924 RepID=A0A9P3HB10_9FUNG|nr:hypothetical protein EMPS_05720 [Entomortierella parvispora]
MSKRGSTPASDGSEDEHESFLTYAETTATAPGVTARGLRQHSRPATPEERPHYPLHSRQYNSQTTLSSSISSGDDEITLAGAVLDPISIPVPTAVTAAAAAPMTTTTTTTTTTGGTTGPAPAPTPATFSKWSTIGHQVSFLGTGIFSTLAVQWLYYQGGASGTSMLTVFFNYIGMMLVGVIFAAQTWYADRRQRRLATTGTAEYDVLMTETTDLSEPGHDAYRDHIELLAGKTGRSKHNMETKTHVLHDEEEEEDEEESLEDMFIREQQALEDMMDEEKQRLHLHKNKLAAPTSGKSRSLASRFGLHWPVIQVAVMDVIANALVTVGFFYVGSGMYQVIYSSIVIWCAILTRIFLSRKLNNVQWVAIVGVTFGLAVSALGTVQEDSPDGPVQSWLEKSFGALITLGATFLYACVYVLSDKVLSTFKPTPVPEKVCSMVGGYAALLTFIYLCVYTFPNWQTEVVEVVEAHGSNWTGIIMVYPLVTISSMLHSLNYYVLLSRINNIAVGIMQSLRAVLVFVMSHYLFCGISQTQCFNEWKFISAIVVIGCVTLFSFSSPPKAVEADAANTTTASMDAAGSPLSADPEHFVFQQQPRFEGRTTALHRTHSPIPRRSASSEYSP